ncbi:hypothetical protein DIPPA_32170 [Diplonema papillatum]|nr:hypothetical protein DIPPA_32170 [Diplonema papillatum]
MKFATLNVTSMLQYILAVNAVEADLLCCQEVTLLRCKRAQAEEYLRNWCCHWGPPPPGRLCRSSGSRSTTNAANGGLSTLVQRPIPAYDTMAALSHVAVRSPDRVSHTVVATGTGSTFVHVFNVYCPSGNGRAENEEREDMLEKVLFAAADSLGDVPILVMGDLNTEEDRSPVLRKALRNGWSDAAELHHARTGNTPPPPTFTSARTSGTRIDRILLNRIAACAFRQCVTTAVNVPGHRLVTVTLDIAALRQSVWRFKVPREIPTEGGSKWDLSDAEADREAVQRLANSEFAERLAAQRVEEAWLEWSRVSEQYLQDAFAVPVEERGRGSGRGMKTLPRRVCVTAGTATDGSGAANSRQLRLRKAIHRMERICSYLAQRRGPEAVPHEVSLCWQNCKRLAQACMEGDQGAGGFPDHEKAKQLLTALREETSRLGREGSAARFTKYRDKLNERADASRRCLATVCAGRAEPSGVLRTGAKMTANVDEMDEVLHTAWDAILRKYKDRPEPEYGPFRDRFQEHIDTHLMEPGTITGEELRTLLRKKPKKSASGVDGWRMAELRELPLPLLNALADVMNLVEVTGVWPASMTTALVSMVPKDESQDPLHTRPITVTSAVYRLWACRRLADIVLWQEKWIEEGQKGFRPGHRIEDVLMEIGLEMEDALLDGEPLYGVALDFRKCFDMVPREIVLRLAGDLGLHNRVLKPLRAIYRLLARRFKLPLGVGREFSVTNGILQGCPVSVILINALLSVVMKAVKKEAEGVSPKSYADDATLLSRLSEAALQKGVDVVDEFCTLTGMELNLQKTVAFSTRRRHQSTLRLRSVDALLRFGKSVTCLGALVSTAKNRTERSDSERVEKAAALAEGLRHAPFRYEKRVRIVQSNVLPAALSGCSFAPVSKVAMKRLTTSVMGLIWGGSNPKRAREMVLNFQEKGHLTDPSTCLAYRVTTAFYAACERLPRLLPLMESIRGRYAEEDLPLGPVGLAMKSMEECGHVWGPGPLSRTLRNGAIFDPIASTPSKRGHEVRADLRAKTWSRLVARRPGFEGVQRADLERTNSFWRMRECPAHTARLIRVALAGGVNTAEFTSRMRQAGAEPQAPSCKHCGSGDTEDEKHVFWDCGAYSHIRRREAHAELMAANRADWPRCTLEHGVVVPENAHFSRRLQEMMAEILAERAGLEARGWVARNPTTPWSRADAMPAEKLDHPFARIAPAWAWERNKAWGLPTFYALVAWLSDMEWTENGQASMLELAIDFELFSGLSIPLHENAPKGVRERGNVLRCMISALDKLATQQGLGSCERGERVCPTTSLSFMGITGISGVRPRPRFREAHTGTILEEQVKGSDVGTQFPTYPDWTAERAARWALPAPPQLHPDPVHMPGVGVEKALVTCATHHKGKCEACRALVRRDVPTVEMCCRHHHHADDGQPIAVCVEHSTTKCGECKTAAACCRSGHHACRTHGRGTCQECRRLPTLAQRRPAACCRRGHHQPNEPNAPATPGHSKKKKRPLSPTQVGVQRETPAGKRAAQAPPAVVKQKTATTGRAAKRPPPTPGTGERPALKKRVLGTPKESPIAGRKRKKAKATTPESEVQRKKRKALKASGYQKRPTSPSTPVPSRVKNVQACPHLCPPTQSPEPQESPAPLAPQVLDLDDAMTGDDVIK